MVWKWLSMLLIISLFIYFLQSIVANRIYVPETKLKKTRTYHTIIFDKEFDTSLLNNTIVKVIKTLSPIPYCFRGLVPITNRISHWFLTLVLDNNKAVVITTDCKMAATIYNARVNYSQHVVNYNDYVGVFKHVYNVDSNITLSVFLNKFVQIIKHNFKCYSLFGKNNCQHVVSSVLEQVFGINTKCEQYGLDIINELYKNKQYSTNFKNIVAN